MFRTLMEASKVGGEHEQEGDEHEQVRTGKIGGNPKEGLVSATQWRLPAIFATMPATFRVICEFYRATKNPKLFRYNSPDADEYAAVNIISIVNLEWDSRKDLCRLDDESYKALTTERLERD